MAPDTSISRVNYGICLPLPLLLSLPSCSLFNMGAKAVLLNANRDTSPLCSDLSMASLSISVKASISHRTCKALPDLSQLTHGHSAHHASCLMPSFLLHITSNLSAEPVSSIFKTPAESDRFGPPPSHDSGPSHHPLLLGHCTRLFLISQFPPFDPHPPPSSLFLSQAKTVPPPPPQRCPSANP